MSPPDDAATALGPPRDDSPSEPLAVAVVALGGSVGAALRWGLATVLPTPTGGLGWSTVGVNLSGSFLLGLLLAVLAGSAAARGWTPRWHHLARLGLGTGLLGGWTTFSTLAVEVDRSLDAGRPGPAAVALLLSLVGGVGLAALGATTGRRLTPGS